jgi:hypothetical protein
MHSHYSFHLEVDSLCDQAYLEKCRLYKVIGGGGVQQSGGFCNDRGESPYSGPGCSLIARRRSPGALRAEGCITTGGTIPDTAFLCQRTLTNLPLSPPIMLYRGREALSFRIRSRC